MDKIICRICGADIDANSSFCSKCGAEIEIDIEAEIDKEMIDKESENEIVKDTEIDTNSYNDIDNEIETDVRHCPQCGQPLSDYTVYCDHCGAMANIASENEEQVKPAMNNVVRGTAQEPGRGGIGERGGMNGTTRVAGGGVTHGAMYDNTKRDGVYDTTRSAAPGTRYSAAKDASSSTMTGINTGVPAYPGEGPTPNVRASTTAYPGEGPTPNIRAGMGYDKNESKFKKLIAKFKELPRPAKIAIIIGIVALLTLVIVGISVLVNHARNLTILPELPTIESPEEPTPAPMQIVRIVHEGEEIREKEIYVEDIVTLRLEIEPDNPEVEIVWSVNNPSVLEIEYISADNTEITVTGISRGMARLTVKVDGIERVCIFRVADIPLIRAESATIMRNNNPVSNEKIWVEDVITLSIKIEPEDADEEDISWFSSNPRILEIVETSPDKTEITVRGVAPGEVVLHVYVGNVDASCRFVVEPNFIDVPHPYVAGLNEFFANVTGETFAYLASVPGLDEQAVLAEIRGNNERNSYRFLHMQDGILRVYDLLNVDANGLNRLFLSSNNHLVTGGTDGRGTVSNVHLFVDGNMRENEVRLSEQLMDDGFYRCMLNGREISQSEYDALIRQYGLNRSIERTNDTARILAMTITVEAPRN